MVRKLTTTTLWLWKIFEAVGLVIEIKQLFYNLKSIKVKDKRFMSKLIPPRDDEEEAAIRPMTLDMYYFWNSETYTLTESEERTLNRLIYKGLPPRIPLDHVKREVSFVFNDFNNTKKTLQQIKFYSVNLAWHLILLVNFPVTQLQK